MTLFCLVFFLFKQKTAYEMRISDWSSDVCSSDLAWQYHNGGAWPMIGGFFIAALARGGRLRLARAELVKLARACALDDWAFAEWLHGQIGRASCRGRVCQDVSIPGVAVS